MGNIVIKKNPYNMFNAFLASILRCVFHIYIFGIFISESRIHLFLLQIVIFFNEKVIHLYIESYSCTNKIKSV